MNDETLIYLLSGGHINMDERISRGIWPHPPLRYSFVLSRLAKEISTRRWFPQKMEPLIPGEAIYEGGIIERRARFHYIYHIRRHLATNPTILAEEAHIRFLTARGVASYFLKWDRHLPGDLDGWKVVR